MNNAGSDIRQLKQKDIAIEKQKLRRKTAVKRDALTLEEREEKSARIIEAVLSHDWYLNCDRILCYRSYKSEVDTTRLIQQALYDGKRAACPKVMGKEMAFFEIRDLSDCEPGAYGILEPGVNCPRIEAEPDKDLLVMPGLCFSDERARLGYGGGYYDRFLAAHRIKSIGLFFDCQEVCGIVQETYDLKPDMIITETRILGI